MGKNEDLDPNLDQQIFHALDPDHDLHQKIFKPRIRIRKKCMRIQNPAYLGGECCLFSQWWGSKPTLFGAEFGSCCSCSFRSGSGSGSKDKQDQKKLGSDLT